MATNSSPLASVSTTTANLKILLQTHILNILCHSLLWGLGLFTYLVRQRFFILYIKDWFFLSLSFFNSCLQLCIQFSDLFFWDISFCGIRWFPCTHMLNTALLNTQWGPSGNLQGPPLYHSFRESAGSGRVLIPFCMTRNIL